MTFKRIQNGNTLEITHYFINDKEVSESQYHNREFECHIKGGQYCNFLTQRDEVGNFVHSFDYV